MLRHGLQGVHNQRIWTPCSEERKPDPEFLERRYERFKQVVCGARPNDLTFLNH
jgi:hypothetical protein